jgi:hypothetical protein
MADMISGLGSRSAAAVWLAHFNLHRLPIHHDFDRDDLESALLFQVKRPSIDKADTGIAPH